MTTRLATATLLATLALAATAPEARSATIQTYGYTTFGTIGDIGNAGPITFTGVSPYNYYPSSGINGGGNTLTTPGSVVLGQVTTSPLPSTATLTYAGTPFTIDLMVYALPGPSYYFPTSPSYDYRIRGELNGSMTNGSSSVAFTVDSITGIGATPPFPISALQVALPQGIAAPSGYNYGRTTMTAQVLVAGIPLPSPAPEPTSIAAFAAALGGWALRRRLRARTA